MVTKKVLYICDVCKADYFKTKKEAENHEIIPVTMTGVPIGFVYKVEPINNQYFACFKVVAESSGVSCPNHNALYKLLTVKYFVMPYLQHLEGPGISIVIDENKYLLGEYDGIPSNIKKRLLTKAELKELKNLLSRAWIKSHHKIVFGENLENLTNKI